MEPAAENTRRVSARNASRAAREVTTTDTASSGDADTGKDKSAPAAPRGALQQLAKLAVRAVHTPATKDVYKTKTAAAAAFGVSKQMLRACEKEMEESGYLAKVQRGDIPPPDMPTNEPEEETKADEFDMKAVEEGITAKCNRIGDNTPYGVHGTKGQYREAIKWAVDAMYRGVLRKDGRRASALLATININVSFVTLHNRLRDYEDSLQAGNQARSGPPPSPPSPMACGTKPGSHAPRVKDTGCHGKRKEQQEAADEQPAAKRTDKSDKDEQRRCAAREGAKILWDNRHHGLQHAMGRLQKKHLHPMLVLSGVRAQFVQSITDLMSLLETAVASDDAAKQEANLRSLVSQFCDVASPTGAPVVSTSSTATAVTTATAQAESVPASASVCSQCARPLPDASTALSSIALPPITTPGRPVTSPPSSLSPISVFVDTLPLPPSTEPPKT